MNYINLYPVLLLSADEIRPWLNKKKFDQLINEFTHDCFCKKKMQVCRKN